MPREYVVGHHANVRLGNTVAHVLVLHAHFVAARSKIIATAATYRDNDDVVLREGTGAYLVLHTPDDRAIERAGEPFIARYDYETRFAELFPYERVALGVGRSGQSFHDG